MGNGLFFQVCLGFRFQEFCFFISIIDFNYRFEQIEIKGDIIVLKFWFFEIIKVFNLEILEK